MKQKRRSALGALGAGLIGLGIGGIMVYVALILFLLSMTVYGLWLAFSASLILGLIVLIVEPSPIVIGLVMFFWDKNLAQMLIDFLNK